MLFILVGAFNQKKAPVGAFSVVVESSQRFVSSSIINPKSILCIIVEVIQKMRLAAPLTLDISYSENSLGSTTSAEAFTSNCYIYHLHSSLP